MKRVFFALSLLGTLGLARSAGAETEPARSPVVAERAREPLPSLARVIALARERAPSVVVGRAELGVARSAFSGARLAPVTNPSVSVLFDKGTMRATKDVTVSGTLVLPVEVSGQRSTRIAEAEALVDLQSAELESKKALATAEAVRLYGVVAESAERKRVLDGIVAVAGREAEVYRARLSSGDATETDAQLARVELAKNVVLAREARADLERALAELERLVGKRFEAPDGAAVEPPPPARLAVAAGSPASSPFVRALEKEAAYHAKAKERASREAFAPLDFIITAGRGDLGEARFGGGLAWSLPVARRNQAEQARADASRVRADVEKEQRSRFVALALSALAQERAEVREASELLASEALPAAQASVDAAIATVGAGKGELLRVLTARRDLASIELRRVELLAREWSIVSDTVALTGELP